MKNNKEKFILLLLILFQFIFIGYQIYNTLNDNTVTLNSVNNTDQNNEVKDNSQNKIKPINDNLTSSQENNSIENNVSKEQSINNEISEINSNKILLIESYIKEIPTTDYIIKNGDTISKILREFESTCNYKTGYKYLNLLNPNINLDEVEINSIIKIPYYTLSSGKLYLVKKGDTWYKLINENYPEYNVDAFSKFLIDINDLPNSDLPLGENIFLPKI